jgi:hypothetical protein
MKKGMFVFAILAMLARFLFCEPVLAISVIADQKTVAWDPVTTDTDGKPLPEGSDVRYRVYIMNSQTLNFVEVTTEPIIEMQYTITFNQEGNFFFGVQAVRYIEGADPIGSKIAWSNDPANCLDGETIDIKHFRPPGNATGLRIP